VFRQTSLAGKSGQGETLKLKQSTAKLTDKRSLLQYQYLEETS